MPDPRYYVRPTRQQWEEARRWYLHDGLSVREIAERLRVTEQAVYYHRKQWEADA